jgi:flagellar basal body-associated protein FliL
MPLREIIPDPKNAAREARRTRQPRRLLVLYRILWVTVFLLLALILGGTLYALVFKGGRQDPAPRDGPGTASAGTEAAGPGTAIFTGLGRLRFPAAGPGGGIIVLSAAFPYDPADRPFSEELASRVRILREITAGYLGSLGPEELNTAGETLLKQELLSRYNAALRLGRIDTLYFYDFMIIE